MLHGFTCIGTRESTVGGWKKEEEKLRSLVQDLEEDVGLKRKRARLANDTQLDSALHQWFVQARADGVPISGAIVQAEAEKFDKQLNGDECNFKASTGWLERFKKRHGISQVSVASEIRSADSEDLCSFLGSVFQCSCGIVVLANLNTFYHFSERRSMPLSSLNDLICMIRYASSDFHICCEGL